MALGSWHHGWVSLALQFSITGGDRTGVMGSTGGGGQGKRLHVEPGLGSSAMLLFPSDLLALGFD